MNKSYFVVGFTGLTMLVAAGAACSSSTASDGDNTLPGRAEAGTDSSTVTVTTDSSAPAESCKDLTLVVGEPKACDDCAKSKCCAEVQACNKSSDCKALQECIAPCAQDDFVCIGTCSEAHSKGAGLLQEVGACAKGECKTECASSEPDAGDPFGDSGL